MYRCEVRRTKAWERRERAERGVDPMYSRDAARLKGQRPSGRSSQSVAGTRPEVPRRTGREWSASRWLLDRDGA